MERNMAAEEDKNADKTRRTTVTSAYYDMQDAQRCQRIYHEM